MVLAVFVFFLQQAFEIVGALLNFRRWALVIAAKSA